MSVFDNRRSDYIWQQSCQDLIMSSVVSLKAAYKSNTGQYRSCQRLISTTLCWNATQSFLLLWCISFTVFNFIRFLTIFFGVFVVKLTHFLHQWHSMIFNVCCQRVSLPVKKSTTENPIHDEGQIQSCQVIPSAWNIHNLCIR